MQLKVLGSSSAGNAYILDNGKEALLIECGLPYRSIQEAVDYDISRIRACILSHEHGDHARSIDKVLKARIPCYMSAGTLEALGLGEHPLAQTLSPLSVLRLGGFTIRGFAVEHDAREPFGYLIHHSAMGLTLFATDTYYLRYRFGGLSNILLECNYRQDILQENVRAGIVSQVQYERTLTSHMSYQSCLEVLAANDIHQVHNIVLIHLSPNNSDATAFAEGVRALTGKTVHIARRGLCIDFGTAPF